MSKKTNLFPAKAIVNVKMYFSSIHQIIFEKKYEYAKVCFIGLFVGALARLTEAFLDYEFKGATSFGDAIMKISQDIWLQLPGWSKFLAYSFAGGLLGIILKVINKRYRTKKVFSMSQPQIFNLFYQLENATKGGGYEKELYVENLKKDRLIHSPLDYSLQTISHSKAPEFCADDKYILELFDSSLNSIVAITSWSPSMWIDPALSFYLINTCLVSLKYDLNSTNPNFEKHELDFFNRHHTSYKEFENSKKNLLEKLSKFNGTLDNFNMIRFFLLEQEWIDAYTEQYLSALYAIHDLFKIKAYFVNKSKLYTKLSSEKLLDGFNNKVKAIWSSFECSDSSLKGMPETKKMEPEFLMLWGFDDSKIHIWSYFDGKPISISGESNPNLCIDSIELINLISKPIFDDPHEYLFKPATQKLKKDNHAIIGWK